MVPLLAGALVAATPPAEGPTDQTLVYYNARMALREGRPMEAVKLWLLRNAIESETRVVSAHDPDMRSVLWAALGRLGLCPDGLPIDDDGVGLWPLALHNWTVRNRRPAPPEPGGSPFEAFEIGRQQRFVSLRDVLNADELETVTLRRTGCYYGLQITSRVAWPWQGLEDTGIAAKALRSLLRESLDTLDHDRVIGRAAIEARLFDLNLRLAGVAERARRRARRQAVMEGRERGLSRAETRALGRDARRAVTADARAARILKRSLRWTVEEWLTLSTDRRQYLFDHATRPPADPVRAVPLALAIADRLIEDRKGAEAQVFIAFATRGDDPELRQAVWGGERGERLLSLDLESGFRERGVIALHRGVEALGRGRMADALRSFAYASKWSEDSRKEEEVRNLARRWLSFVAARFRVTDELLAMMKSVVPRTDFNAVLEDQLWQAAFSADTASFERCLRYQSGRGAMTQRGQLLKPLATGDAGAFADALAGNYEETPYFAVRFVGQMLERLQAQDAELRRRHLPLLRRVKVMLEERIAQTGEQGQRRTLLLIDQIRSIVDGLAPMPGDASATDRASALSPDRELFAGSVRIAPSDPLPWPFRVPETRAPSVFTALDLTPVEWRADDGSTLYGWRVSEP